MSAVATKTEITPEDLLAMPDEKNFELVDGQLEERNVSALSSWVGVEISFLVRSYLKDHPVGMLFGADNGYQCYPDKPRKVRRADVSLIRHERLPVDWQTAGYLRTPPDLVVEVVSPNDLAIEVDEKVFEYLRAGVNLIWVIVPNIPIVQVVRADYTGVLLTENDELSGEDVLPGFRCPIRAIFPPPVVAAEAAGR